MSDIIENADEYKALINENESLRNILEKLNAEKTAIDQMLVEQIKSNLQLRTEINLMQQKLSDREKRIINLSNSLEEIHNNLPQKDLSEVPVCGL